MWLLALVIGAGAFVHSDAYADAPRRPAGDTSPTLAVVGDEAITLDMVEKRLEEIPEQYRGTYTTASGRRQLLDRIIEERIWLQQAESSGLAERAEIQDQLERQRRDLLVRTYVNERMAERPAVTDSQARVYYDEHLDDYRIPATVTLQHILLDDEKRAHKILRWAQKGSDWGKLVRKYSRDSLTHPTEGSLGTVTRDGVFATIGAQPALAESAMALGAPNIGGPYQTNRGWHVIRVGGVQAEGMRSFEEVRSLILRQLTTESSQEQYQVVLATARAGLAVDLDSVEIERWASRKKSAREMFQEAQALGPAADRLAAYRAIVATYPDSAVSVQSQFMIGFINSEELKNYDEAEKAFRELLERYGNSELAESARWMLENMRTKDAPDFVDTPGDPPAGGNSQEGSGSP